MCFSHPRECNCLNVCYIEKKKEKKKLMFPQIRTVNTDDLMYSLVRNLSNNRRLFTFSLQPDFYNCNNKHF